jgi:hypothetical protein
MTHLKGSDSKLDQTYKYTDLSKSTKKTTALLFIDLKFAFTDCSDVKAAKGSFPVSLGLKIITHNEYTSTWSYCWGDPVVAE